MLRPIMVSLCSISVVIAGCTSQNASDQKNDGSTPTAAMPSIPKSKQDSATPIQSQDLGAAQPLIIKVDSRAQIGGVVRSVFQDARGVLWVGGEGDLFRNDGKTLTSYDIRDDEGNGVTIKRIIEDKEGNIWCGTTHKGICRYDGKVFTNFTQDGIVDGNEIWCVHEDQVGNIWFSGKRFGVYRYDGNSFTKFDEKDGLSTPGIMCILDDSEGRLWLGGVNGLFRYDGKSFINVNKDGPWSSSKRYVRSFNAWRQGC